MFAESFARAKDGDCEMGKMESMVELTVGARVYSPLKGQAGIITDIQGLQGRAWCWVKVIFQSGEAVKVLDSVIKGSWLLQEGIATAAEVSLLTQRSEIIRQEKEGQAAREKAFFEKTVEELKQKDDLAFLVRTQGDDTTSGKTVAVNIRLELKRAFPATKFSVRRPHYGVVNVSWKDGPTIQKVEDLLGRYETGRFDSMQDLPSTEVGPFNVVFGGTRYLFTERQHSDALIEKALDRLYARFPSNLKEISRPRAIDYNTGALFSIQVQGFSMTFQQLVAAELTKIEL